LRTENPIIRYCGSNRADIKRGAIHVKLQNNSL
jgi:hypothetical protein